jgi:hypothetical protein
MTSLLADGAKRAATRGFSSAGRDPVITSPQEQFIMKRQILAVSAATVVAVAALVGTGLAAGATHAAAATSGSTNPPPNSYISYPTGVHNAPNSKAPVTKVLAAGTPVAALCVVPDGSEEGGNTTWFRIATDQPGGGWVPRVVMGGVPDLPRCAPAGQ